MPGAGLLPGLSCPAAAPPDVTQPSGCQGPGNCERCQRERTFPFPSAAALLQVLLDAGNACERRWKEGGKAVNCS